MYDLPFDDPTRAGWILTGVVVVLLIARAVRSQYRFRRQVRNRRVRLMDVGLDAVCALAVVALVVLLVAIPVTTLV